MSDLINQIRAAQVRAGEDVVTANLRSMGLSVNQRQPRANQDVHQVLGEALYDQARTRELTALRSKRDTLVNALRQIATTDACSNSDPDVMGEALDNAVAIAQGALRACQQRVRCTVPPEASAIGAELDPKSLEQGDIQ